MEATWQIPRLESVSRWLTRAHHALDVYRADSYDRMTREIYEQKGLTLITVTPTEVKGFDNRHALGTGERVFVRLRERLPIPRRWLSDDG
ncbi:MAG: hypothetical protein ACSLFO_09345 [Acidimicrobiales bacterium]